ncbi:WxL domain-containing protein [Enterococcus faecalis]|uniref:WxL domain-containing protein n=2 Tax=Enterococcus faecalis TaxID=1351 RepID=UPI0022E826C4|nr:WxL domain-containing protein [Enterococcus faecalis]
MKQIKFKQLATLGLCCSLLMNSLGGVTAFAETVTIESSPTVESTKESTQKSEVSKQEEATKETTGATEKPVSSDTESQEQSTMQEAVKEEEPKQIEEKPQQVPDLLQNRAIGVKAGNIVVYEDAVEFPEETFQFGFVNQDGQLVKSDDITITYDYSEYLTNNGINTWNGIALNQKATTVEKLKKITMPKSILPKNTVNGEAMINISFSLPKYYTGLNIYNKSGKIDSNYPLPPRHYYKDNQEVIGLPSDASFITWLTLAKAADNSYVFKDALTSTAPVNSSFPMMRRGISGDTYYHSLDAPVYYHLTQRKVTENFVDASGTKITPPTGFTQGKRTGIDSDPYTFKQSGTLPETYKASNGKTYKFKGWYKGKTKPATLQTTKTPSYAVTYDGNDDLNVVYEELVEQTATIPAVTYKFGFVDEKGALVAPSSFVMKTNLTTVMNETPKQVGTATGVNNGNLKQLTIPSQTLTYTSGVNPAFSGATDFQLTVPKYYKIPTVKPGAHYTGSSTAYPIAKTRARFINSAIPDERLEVNGEQYYLNGTPTAHSYKMFRSYWTIDTTKTAFDGVLSRAVTDNASGMGQPHYFTTDDTMYYFLENRRVTENFVDATGAKITPPTGFTQGKQTMIDSSPYTFKQSGTLPDTYTSGGKTYKFKGWYKGKTKPATLQTTKTPSYAVTFDDNDDLNVVYEVDMTKDYKFPSNTVNFQFINEAGTIISPTFFTITTDLQQEINSTYTKLGAITGTNSGNTKQITIPAKTLRADVSLGGVNNYGTTNTRITIPRFYENISVYTGNAYKQATLNHYSTADNTLIGTPASNATLYYGLNKVTATQYKVNEYDSTITIPEKSEYLYNRLYVSGANNKFNSYYTPVGTIYYQLTNRKVTENFVDAKGAKITPPTGFTQGKQTVVDSSPYTFKQSGTLPDTYTSGGKTYKFKGWYKGKTKPATLQTAKTPSYAVTFDDNDDLNVVYEEIEAFDFPALTYQFGFLDESGNRVDASTIGLTYDNWHGEVLGNKDDWKTVSLERGQIASTKNNLKEIVYPAQSFEILSDGSSQYSAANITFTLPKYYEKISVYNKSGTFDVGYPFPNIQNNNNPEPSVEGSNKNLSSWFELKKNGSQSFIFNQTTGSAPIDVQVPAYLREIVYNPNQTSNTAAYYAIDKPVYYYLTNRKVTENFVDPKGAKITPPTGFTQGKQTVIDSDNFTYTSAKALPASYTADGKTYLFQGWYKGSEKPATLETGATPSYPVSYNDQDDMTAIYKEATISADLTMRGSVDVIDNGATMEYWEVLLKNTGEAPITSVTIKPTTEWAAGISAPTNVFILGDGQNAKSPSITKEQWEAGFEIPLDNSLPVGGQLTINLIGTKVTGQPNQVLKAAVEVTGNFNKLTASDTVRIKDLDQEIKEPAGEGFISVPTFDFGQVGVASATKQHGLKKAADYYGNGTRNPYVRIKKTQPNWSLTAQLSQPKSVTDSLPTATRLLLGAAPVSSFSNYNQPTELKNAIGTTNAIHLTANNAATSIIANQQFTGSDVYQLDFTFDNIKLEVPANQGTAGQQYQAAVTWNLVTGP